MTIVVPPSDVQFGYVVGRIVRAVADSGDTGRDPDFIPASGTVTFKPLRSVQYSEEYPATIIKEAILCSISPDTGELLDTQMEPGVWLVAGHYEVSFSLNSGSVPSFTLKVEGGRGVDNPIDLSLSAPLVPDPTVKFIVNEQIYIDTLKEAENAKEFANDAKASADAAESEVNRRLTELKDSGQLTGPQGIQGPRGLQGIQGIQGPKGDKGDKGDTGPVNSLSIGTVTATTGTPSATITGTSPSQTLNLVLKTGATGAKGATGEKGDKGDQGEGLNVRGTLDNESQLPTTGAPGYAYIINQDLWVWDSVQGKYINAGSVKGPKGDTGDPGTLPDATPTSRGIMSAADKAILDTATANATGSALMRRDSSGRVSVGTPEITAHAATKGYVDAGLNAKVTGTTTIGADVDLDTIQKDGFYMQGATANAKAELNYPIGVAGHLVVGHSGGMTYQTYTVYGPSGTTSSRTFVRGRYLSDWSPWREYAFADLATSSRDGLMSRSDKALLDTATSFSTSNALVRRNGDGKADFQYVGLATDPTRSTDATRKSYVDSGDATAQSNAEATAASALAPVKALTDAATPNATASTIVRRDANNRFRSGTPSASTDVATKGYVDGLANSSIRVVSHGTNANTARPSGASVVYWVGSVEPNNAQDNDLWRQS